jgi:uncharacterized protein (DUF2235 family)
MHKLVSKKMIGVQTLQFPLWRWWFPTCQQSRWSTDKYYTSRKIQNLKSVFCSNYSVKIHFDGFFNAQIVLHSILIDNLWCLPQIFILYKLMQTNIHPSEKLDGRNIERRKSLNFSALIQTSVCIYNSIYN